MSLFHSFLGTKMSQGSSSILEHSFVSVRIVTMDYYLAKPITDIDPTFSSSRSHVVKRVPILRIFGPTASGQKACLHLHGVFPYFYIPLPNDPGDNFCNVLATSLERALNLSMGESNSKDPQVFKVQIVSGVPYYGYHPRSHQFLKIYLYNPMMVKKAADLLQNGGVMGKKFQPHESHVPYTLQFMMDYNLQGMNFVHLSNAKFRRNIQTDEEALAKLRESNNDGESLSSSLNLDQSTSDHPNERKFDVSELSDYYLMPDSVTRVSTTELELDAVAVDILNSNEGEGNMNPGLKAIWEDERTRRLLLDLNDHPLTPPGSPPRDNACMVTDSEQFWKDRLKEKLDKIKSDPNEFVSETGQSQSSDPDATCNFLEEDSNKEKEDVYASETPETSAAPNATLVEHHVPSLSFSLSASSSSWDILGQISHTEEDKEAETTIIDENVVRSQSQNSQDQQVLLQQASFNEDENEIIELLAELGQTRKSEHPETSKDELQSINKDSDDAETLEMSQIVFDDDEEFEKLVKDVKLEPEKESEKHHSEEFFEDSENDDLFLQINLDGDTDRTQK